MKKTVKLITIITFLIVISFLIIIIRYRINTSNGYLEWFNNYSEFLTWYSYYVSWNYTYSVYLPLKEQKFQLQVDGAALVDAYIEFDWFWLYKEYKYISGRDLLLWNAFSVNIDSAYYPDHSVFRKPINFFMENWWKVSWVILWMIPNTHQWTITIRKIN